MQALRQARRRVALAVALADIMELLPLEGVTRSLSDFADAAVNAAARHLLQRGIDAGDLAPVHADNPLERSGLVILGMGKLGARELNYSSDIDLIVLYDPEIARYTGKRTIQYCFVRMARRSRAHAAGAHRRGLCLPHRSETAARSRLDAAGDLGARRRDILREHGAELGAGGDDQGAAGRRRHRMPANLPRRLRPFVWRKHLDFAAIQDIHSIKRQIHAHEGPPAIAVAGHNIKLGRGGIREIEFFAQTQQLIWGGRDPELRQSATCAAHDGPGRGRPDRAAQWRRTMIEAYRFLRRIEHRLQMIEDRQTQTLPRATARNSRRSPVRRISLDAAAFRETLLRHLRRVEDHYADLFEEAPALGGPGNLVFTGTDDDPDTVQTLGRMGFGDGASVARPSAAGTTAATAPPAARGRASF